MEIKSNIYFKIGQPSTGKSFGFAYENLKDNDFFTDFNETQYKLIPVSGGIGNEYKGLQNTDLAISYDVINETLKLGDFLKMLMLAIKNPEKQYVVFLDDFHNQDISSLLSEYTPLFKAQQKVDLTNFVKAENTQDLDVEKFDSTSDFIDKWNVFIETLRKKDGVSIVPITNRLSGEDIKLVYPANFYLFGAANFNEKTVNIFADWADRAYIESIDPIKLMKDFKKIKEINDNDFVDCVVKINEELQMILEEHGIYDYEKYCFGIWKLVDEKGNVETDDKKQKKLIIFLLGMIKNALIYNNKNSLINEIGTELLTHMKDDKFFKLTDTELEDKKTLHKYGIYES